MIDYYTSIIILCWLSLGVLSILVKENEGIARGDKWVYYLTYVLIAFAALSEWLGVKMSGDSGLSTNIIRIIKCEDYILTPAAGAVIVGQMKMRNKVTKMLMLIVAFNTVFQIIAAIAGWIIVFDEYNNYIHGPLYPLYMVVYVLIIILVIIEFIIYANNFRRQNKLSIYSIMVFVVIGVLMQEVCGSDIRTAYIALTIGAAFLFIYYNEFFQISNDDKIQAQHKMLMFDALTGALSRYAYNIKLKEYKDRGICSDNLAVYVIDINGLKKVNDRYGHEYGDDLICGAVSCIKETFDGIGECYRTGGDEFVVFSEINKEQAEERQNALSVSSKKWQGKLAKNLRLAIGYVMAEDYNKSSIEELVIKADELMYEDKQRYYVEHEIRKKRNNHE